MPVERYDNGIQHTFVALGSEDDVTALRPNLDALAELEVMANCFAGSGIRWKTRMFAPSSGVAEDPATGSAAGPLAVHVCRHAGVPWGEWIEISQGAEIGRPSRLFARADARAATSSASQSAATRSWSRAGSSESRSSTSRRGSARPSPSPHARPRPAPRLRFDGRGSSSRRCRPRRSGRPGPRRHARARARSTPAVITYDPCDPSVSSTSETPSARSRSGSALPTRVAASSSFSLRIATCRRTSPMSASVRRSRGPRGGRAPARRRAGAARFCERGERPRRELGPDQRAHVDPGRVADRLEALRWRPGVAYRVLAHDPALAFVVEAVRGRRGGLVPGDREAERLQRRDECGPVLGGARGGDVRVRAETCERPRGVEHAPARARVGAGDDVAREVPDCGDRGHAGAAPWVKRRDTTATAPASTNEKRKLGTVAPISHCGGSSRSTRSTHQLGPVGKSHW